MFNDVQIILNFLIKDNIYCPTLNKYSRLYINFPNVDELKYSTLHGIILNRGGANCYVRPTHAILEAHCAARLSCAWLESNVSAAQNIRYGRNERNP